ncbi:MAG TPA: rhodanese-like domain-containing protein [Gemmatimonadaceae bacterium]|nr:rhodanese-like domain-containing protein [Gemmatimonadaceae bacterium]
MSDSGRGRLIVRGLAITALILGGLAVVAGSPRRSGPALDVTSLARAVENEDDHVTAVELARWIRDRKPGLRIVDVRDSADFEDYHIPVAERIPLDSLAHSKFKPSETVVLYSGGGAHAAQGWVFLKALGNEKVFFLRGGVDEWLDEVMNPQFPRNASPAEKVEMDSIAALSRYFGGVPRQVDSLVVSKRGAEKSSWHATVAKVRGRGC